ncbi:hypothetical protein GDO81_026644 [Engystomops pustulosus]|uniref:Nephrocystin-1 n=1 Tax=Engystomops pustulosus TaxID=76066 RepID=A0AAV6ZUL5_ENGPU|nr:hypothetical protein GDO81_026644 [Engystomops pustulosus]
MSVKKTRGPLQNVIKLTDDLKRQFDDILQETLEKDVLEPRTRKDVYQRCVNLKNMVLKNREALQGLKKADEPGPVGNYDQRKEDEDRRLVQLSNQLQNLAKTLGHGEGEDESNQDVLFTNRGTAGDEDESEEEEYEEEGEDEEEEEEEEEEEDELDITAKHFISLGDFQAQQKEDLTFQKGEVLQILDKKPDGWWVAQNSKGVQGLVPKTYLQMSTSKKTQEMSAAEALATMGTVPSGFRTSTLSQHLENGDQCKAGRYLQPELTSSQLGFKDLLWESEKEGILPLPARVSVFLTLWSCKMIPLPGASIQILSRHVRLCLFDGRSPVITGKLPSLSPG